MWKKSKDGWIGEFNALKVDVKPKADGRWTWDVYKAGTPNPMASGVASSAGQAKRNSQNFAERGQFDV